MAVITNDTFNIGKFVEIDGNTIHIGTDRDLLNIIESKCGYEVAEIVGKFVDWSLEYDNVTETLAKLKDELYTAEDTVNSLELDLDEAEDKINRLSKIINTLEDYTSNHITTQKPGNDIIKDIHKILKERN